MITDIKPFASMAENYAKSKGIAVDFQRQFGCGTDGIVWATSSPSALKILFRQENYVRERDAYLRLRERNVRQIRGFSVPQLLGYSDESSAIEMGIVEPPYILDFGKAWVDKLPPYWRDPHVIAANHEEGRDLFEENWGEVKRAIGVLRGMGIYYFDLKPGNIRFADQ